MIVSFNSTLTHILEIHGRHLVAPESNLNHSHILKPYEGDAIHNYLQLGCFTIL